MAYIALAVGLTGVPRDAAPLIVLAALGSGVGLGAGYGLLIVGLKVDEASRAVAISQIYPIFVALLAIAFLGETLNAGQWAAIFLVVLGTMLVSLPGVPHRPAELRPTRGTPLLLGSGLLLALSVFAAKVALLETSFATVFIYQQAGTMLVFLPFIRPRIWPPALGGAAEPADADAAADRGGPAAADIPGGRLAGGQAGADFPGVGLSSHHAAVRVPAGDAAERFPLAFDGRGGEWAGPGDEVRGDSDDSGGSRRAGAAVGAC